MVRSVESNLNALLTVLRHLSGTNTDTFRISYRTSSDVSWRPFSSPESYSHEGQLEDDRDKKSMWCEIHLHDMNMDIHYITHSLNSSLNTHQVVSGLIESESLAHRLGSTRRYYYILDIVRIIEE